MPMLVPALVLFSAAPVSLWPPEVVAALGKTGTNRAEIVAALEKVPAPQRPGMAFLVANMPERDLRSLKASFLLEDVALGYAAQAEAAWKIPDDLFLNDVLPYANL